MVTNDVAELADPSPAIKKCKTGGKYTEYIP